MKLNDRYIKATLAGIPYLLPYGQLIADPAPATRLNDSGALLWDGILEGDSREELLALLADRYHATERERAALAEDVDQYLHSLCRMIHPKAGAMIRLLFSTASVLWSFPTAVPLSYTTASSPLFPAKRKTSTRRFLF